MNDGIRSTRSFTWRRLAWLAPAALALLALGAATRKDAPPDLTGSYSTGHSTLALVEGERRLIASYSGAFTTAGGSVDSCSCVLDGTRRPDGSWALRSDADEAVLELGADALILRGGLRGCCGLSWLGEDTLPRRASPLPSCRVTAARAPFFAPGSPPTELRVYVVKGDVIQAYPDAPMPAFAPARFEGTRSRTAGLLRLDDFECAPPPGVKK